MGEKKKRRVWILISLMIIIFLCLGSIVGGYFFLRKRSMNGRPLVLIHKPENQMKVQEGEIITLHATGRGGDGIQKMKIWIDDQLIKEKVPVNSNSKNITLMGVWHAQQPGNHVIIAEVITKEGMKGQASIIISVQEAENLTQTHTIGVGETIESIANAHTVDVNVLADANPGLGEIGDELTIPGDGLSDIPEEGIVSDEAAPIPEGVPPGSIEDVFEPLGFDFSNPFEGSTHSSPIGLQFNLLELIADEYEGLHCYVKMGYSQTRWYPDLDNNQSTDESFTLIGERSWDVAPYFTFHSSPIIFWPQDEALNMRVKCVGINGGMDSLDLGVWEEEIAPERWTGISLTGDANGPDGSFAIRYRIDRIPADEDVIPAYLDLDMTPPTNARLDTSSRKLLWDYEPRDDEDVIDGFRIYLNNTLQWIEPSDSLESNLPDEWLHPPCGERYIFSVTAFRYGIPDGPESIPAITSIDTPMEGCSRQIEISFRELETFDLGGDDSGERKIGDVGPAYGDFIANDGSIHFSGGSIGSIWGNLDYPAGLNHNTVYDLFDMWRSGGWGFDQPPHLTVDVPPSGSFQFGFFINDDDDESGNDIICEGYSDMYLDNGSGALDHVHEGTLMSSNGRCQLKYWFGPAIGSPVGSGEEGGEPLPDLYITELEVDADSGSVNIHLENIGTAAWPQRDLQIELLTRERESLGIYTWPDFYMERGSSIIIQTEMPLDDPNDLCALVDPNEMVPEAGETTNGFANHPICTKVPDLRIASVSFDAVENSYRMEVENLGESLVNRPLDFSFYVEGESEPIIDYRFTGNIQEGTKRAFILSNVSEDKRLELNNGYTLVVDENNQITESDENNNTFEVTPTLLDICWCDSHIPHFRGSGSSARITLTIETVYGESIQVVQTAYRESTLASNESSIFDFGHTWDQGHSDSLFSCGEHFSPVRVLNDGYVRIRIDSEFQTENSGPWDDLGSATLPLPLISLPYLPESTGNCEENGHYEFRVRPSDGNYDNADWFSVLTIGRINP